MAQELDGMKKLFSRLALFGVLATTTSACSSIPDWVDPTTWIGGGGPADSETAPGQTPDLAAIPDRPTPTSTPDAQRQVMATLAADRSRAKYSADALRGGTEPAAAPPPPDAAADAAGQAAASAPEPAAPSTPSDSSSTASPLNESTPGSTADASAVQQASGGSAAPTPAPVAQELPPASEAPQTPPSTTSTPSPTDTSAMVSAEDQALGFKPSTAPPLDPTISRFVPAPIVAQYQQAAQAAGISSLAGPQVKAPAAPATPAQGGPDAMSGAVVANLESLGKPSASMASAYADARGGAPAAVVLFPGDGTLLNAEGRAQVRIAVEAFKRTGGNAYLRIVGHSSSRTSNMPLEKHLEIVFAKSQDRADAVAAEAIREGVPANRVLVEAVGDSQPVYYESMPKGEDGNRRAEIFVQS
jgi:outer membrane protein OmpA-like peptidoglycan-associated protein